MSATTTTTPSVEPEYTSPRLLVIVTAGILLVTGLITAFCVVGQWWLLPITMLALLFATGLVAIAFGQALAVGARVEARKPEPAAPEAAPEQPRRVPAAAGRPVLGH
jgi:hypothetical protein